MGHHSLWVVDRCLFCVVCCFGVGCWLFVVVGYVLVGVCCLMSGVRSVSFAA